MQSKAFSLEDIFLEVTKNEPTKVESPKGLSAFKQRRKKTKEKNQQVTAETKKEEGVQNDNLAQ